MSTEPNEQKRGRDPFISKSKHKHRRTMSESIERRRAISPGYKVVGENEREDAELSHKLKLEASKAFQRNKSFHSNAQDK